MKPKTALHLVAVAAGIVFGLFVVQFGWLRGGFGFAIVLAICVAAVATWTLITGDGE